MLRIVFYIRLLAINILNRNGSVRQTRCLFLSVWSCDYLNTTFRKGLMKTCCGDESSCSASRVALLYFNFRLMSGCWVGTIMPVYKTFSMCLIWYIFQCIYVCVCIHTNVCVCFLRYFKQALKH